MQRPVRLLVDMVAVHTAALLLAAVLVTAHAGSGLFLGYMLTPSTLHTAWLRMMYRW